MYRHNATSIKETNEKMFISEQEKALFDSYETTKRRSNDTYTRSQIDELMKQTEDVKVSLSSENGVVLLDNNYKGIVEVVNLKGRTLQNTTTLEVSAVGEKINDSQYNISLKSMNAGNLLDLSDKPYIENDIRVLYTSAYNSIVERYGDRGLKVTAIDPAIRSCGFIRIPDYPVDLHVKVDVIGSGCVSLKTLDHVSDYFSGIVSNKTVRFTIPANSGLRKIELDAGDTRDVSVIYDNIVISTFRHDDDKHWEEYKEDRIDIISPVQLHSGFSHNNKYDGKLIYDELFIENGKLLIQNRFKTVKLNDVIDTSVVEAFKEDLYENHYRVNIVFEVDPIYGELSREYRLLSTVCDKLPSTHNTAESKNFIAAEIYKLDSKIYFFVKIEKTIIDRYGGSTMKERFINYLKSLDATVTYETYKNNVIEIADLNKLSLQLFENTVIDIESSVKPSKIDIISPTNFSSVLSENISELELLEKEIKSLSNISEEAVLDVKMNTNVIELDSTPGLIDEVTINGKTYVNLFPSLDKVYIDTGGTTTTFGRNDDGSIYWEATEPPTNHQFAHVASKYFRGLKPNTEYTVVAKVKENTASKFMLCDSGNNSDGTPGPYLFNKNVYINNKVTGIVSGITITREDIDTANRRYSLYLGKGVTGKIVIEKIMMFEGRLSDEEICMVTEQTSMLSVANNEPLTFTSKSTKNLFDGKYVHGYIGDSSGIIQQEGVSLYAISGKSYIPCEANEDYFINIELPEDKKYRTQFRVYFYGTNKEYLGFDQSVLLSVGMTVPNGYRFTTPKDAKYLRFRLYSGDTTQVYETNYKTVLTKRCKNSLLYSEYKGNSTSIDLSKYGVEGGLKSLPDGKRDRIFKKNGKYYIEQVAGYVKLTGDIPDNRWYVSSLNGQFNNIQCFIYRVYDNSEFLPPYIESAYNVSNLLTNLLKAISPRSTTNVGANVEKVGVSVYDQNSNELRIAVPKSDLQTLDLAGFKKWLDDNNGLEVIYQLAEPRIIEIKEDLDLMLYEDESEISVEGGCAIPEVTFKTGRYIQTAVNSMMKKVNELEKEQVDRIKLIIDSTYSADLSLHKTMLMSVNSRVINERDEELISILKTYINTNSFDRDKLEQQIDLFTLIDKIDFETSIKLFDMISELRDIIELEN